MEAARDHEWFRYPSLRFESCRVCGIVRRADGKNKPCRGPVYVALRGASPGTKGKE